MFWFDVESVRKIALCYDYDENNNIKKTHKFGWNKVISAIEIFSKHK